MATHGMTIAKASTDDFEKYESVIKPELNEYLCRFFDHYVCVLKKTVENKGIVYYS